MKKSKISRDDLKTDFLKTTIIRIDYDYLFDNHIEKVMQNLDEYLGNMGYTIRNEMLAEFGFSVDMNNLIGNENATFLDNINVENDKREKYSSFINEADNIKIDITRGYSSITVNYKNHIHFDKIRNIFEKIISELKNVRTNLSTTRIGLRKTNIYIIDNLDKINDIFEEKVFYFNSSLVKNSEIIKRKCIEVYNYDKYTINETTAVDQGTLTTKDGEEEEVYQLVVDFDIYLKDVNDDNINLDEMNDKLFEIYKITLKESFLNKLMDANFEEEGLYKL